MKTMTLMLAIAVLGLYCATGTTSGGPETIPGKTGVFLPGANKTAPPLPTGPRYSNGYFVHGSFEELFIEPEYTCYGFYATGKYVPHTCSLCHHTYYTQAFSDKNGKSYMMYSYSQCSISGSGYHDNLDLEDIYPCHCPANIYTR